jgi:hypothetical protein
MTKRSVILLVLVAACIGSGAAWRPVTAGAEPPPPAAPAPVPVVTTNVQVSDVPIVMTGIGTVEPYNVVDVHTEVTGTIEKIGFVEGQAVKPGDLIAQLDPRPYQAALQQAEATLESDQAHLDNAEVNLRRYQTLLNRWGPIVTSALAKLPQLADVTSDQQSSAPQLTLSIDRDAASRLGITASAIDITLYDAFGQRPIAQLYTSLSQYYVIEEVDPHFQLGPDALKRIYIASQTSGMVPLSELVTLHITTAPLAVNHLGQFPSVTVSFNLKGNEPLGPAAAAVDNTIAALHLPSTIQTGFQGNALAFQASLSSEPVLILGALIAVYIILGMLYENLVHPLTIISTLPAAGLGALLLVHIRIRSRRHRHGRHHFADRHRQEEWHHASGLRAGRRADSRPDPRGVYS